MENGKLIYKQRSPMGAIEAPLEKIGENDFIAHAPQPLRIYFTKGSDGAPISSTGNASHGKRPRRHHNLIQL